MNIAVFSIPLSEQSGFSEYTKNLSQQLKSFSHAVTNFSVSFKSGNNKRIYNSLNFADPYEYIKYSDIIRQKKFDCVIINYDRSFFPDVSDKRIHYFNFTQFVRSINCPVVLIFHSNFDSMEDFYRDLLKKMLLERQIKFIVHNEELKKQLINISTGESANIFLLPHACEDVNTLTSEEIKTLNKLRKKYKKNKILISLGFIAEWKNQLFLLEVLRKVIDVDPNVLLFIIGSAKYDIPYFRKCQIRIKEMDLSGKVILKNEYISLSKYRILLKMADIYAACHKYDDHPTSGSIAYALSAGKAVVTRPFSYLFSHNIQNSVVMARTVDEFSAAIISLLNNKKQRKSLEKKAMVVSKSWSWDQIGKKMEEICLNSVNLESLQNKRLLYFFPSNFMSRVGRKNTFFLINSTNYGFKLSKVLPERLQKNYTFFRNLSNKFLQIQIYIMERLFLQMRM